MTRSAPAVAIILRPCNRCSDGRADPQAAAIALRSSFARPSPILVETPNEGGGGGGGGGQGCGRAGRGGGHGVRDVRAVHHVRRRPRHRRRA